jgi:hypothetical protein
MPRRQEMPPAGAQWPNAPQESRGPRCVSGQGGSRFYGAGGGSDLRWRSCAMNSSAGTGLLK